MTDVRRRGIEKRDEAVECVRTEAGKHALKRNFVACRAAERGRAPAVPGRWPKLLLPPTLDWPKLFVSDCCCCIQDTHRSTL